MSLFLKSLCSLGKPQLHSRLAFNNATKRCKSSLNMAIKEHKSFPSVIVENRNSTSVTGTGNWTIGDNSVVNLGNGNLGVWNLTGNITIGNDCNLFLFDDIYDDRDVMCPM